MINVLVVGPRGSLAEYVRAVSEKWSSGGSVPCAVSVCPGITEAGTEVWVLASEPIDTGNEYVGDWVGSVEGTKIAVGMGNEIVDINCVILEGR